MSLCIIASTLNDFHLLGGWGGWLQRGLSAQSVVCLQQVQMLRKLQICQYWSWCLPCQETAAQHFARILVRAKALFSVAKYHSAIFFPGQCKPSRKSGLPWRMRKTRRKERARRSCGHFLRRKRREALMLTQTAKEKQKSLMNCSSPAYVEKENY